MIEIYHNAEQTCSRSNNVMNDQEHKLSSKYRLVEQKILDNHLGIRKTSQISAYKGHVRTNNCTDNP